MTQYVKKFIEKNIQLIEDDKWRDVFLAWYDDAEAIWPNDNAKFEDFINTLQNVGIDANLDIAHAVIQEIVEGKLTADGSSILQRNRALIFNIVNNLNSFLGHSEQDIEKIIDETATRIGMRYHEYLDGGGYSW